MGIGKIIKAGLALYGAHELLKDRKKAMILLHGAGK